MVKEKVVITTAELWWLYLKYYGTYFHGDCGPVIYSAREIPGKWKGSGENKTPLYIHTASRLVVLKDYTWEDLDKHNLLTSTSTFIVEMSTSNY